MGVAFAMLREREVKFFDQTGTIFPRISKRAALK